jgi:perosamine synthetase
MNARGDPLKRKFIPVSHPVFAGNEKKYVNECLDDVWISSAGEFIGAFESAFARFCGVTEAISCNNGTAALHLALQALGVSPGDEVIVPTLTYIATANAVRYCNATPVFVDSEPRTMNVDPAGIEARITPRTRGIIVVHLFGHPVDMNPILNLASRRGLFVLEDAAESHGALYLGAKTGALGTAATFSFFGNKIITTGEGGMVTTCDKELAGKMRLLRGQGMDPQRRYWFPIVGNNFRMTNIEAALGLAQLEKIDYHLETRRKIASWYGRHLVPLQDRLELPTEEPWARHSYWIYSILLKNGGSSDRDKLMRQLAMAGIETRPVFYPMHVMPPYLERLGSYPVAESCSGRGILLPTHGLLEEEDVAYIAQILSESCLRSQKQAAGCR